MPDTDHFSDIPVPLYSEGADLPGALGAVRDSIGPRIVLYALNESDRNARYADVPIGTIVSSTETSHVWKKTSAGWVEVYSDTGWVSLASVTWQPDWTDNGSSYRVLNGVTTIAIDAVYGGSDTPAGPNGGLSSKILDLPAAALPASGTSPFNRIVGRYAIDGAAGAYGDIVAYVTLGLWIRTLGGGATLASGNRAIGTISFVRG